MAERNPTRIKLTEERRSDLVQGLQKLYHNEFDEDLSKFQAEEILGYFVRALGPPVYNQAIADARAFLADKLEDLDAEFFEPDDSP